MNTHKSLVSLFSDIANAIRAKTGSGGTIKADNFPSAIRSIETGTDTSDATGTAADLLASKTMYGANGKVTGTIASKGAQTYTPGTADQTIASGQYLSGAQTIKGDADLVAANIKKDVEIFGVTGTFEGGTDISDTTATAADVLSPKKFHLADGTLETGTIASKAASDVTASDNTVTVPAGYYASEVQKSVAGGTAGTPTATKGAVSNHSVAITPKVTNTTGYITGGEKTGTAVTVTASELVSGTKTITANGTGIDVSDYASVNVSVDGGSSAGGNAKIILNINDCPVSETIWFAERTVTIPENGKYYILVSTAWCHMKESGGHQPVSVKINGTAETPGHYSIAYQNNYYGWTIYSFTKYLSSGDVITIRADAQTVYGKPKSTGFTALVMQITGGFSLSFEPTYLPKEEEYSGDDIYFKLGSAPTSNDDYDFRYCINPEDDAGVIFYDNRTSPPTEVQWPVEEHLLPAANVSDVFIWGDVNGTETYVRVFETDPGKFDATESNRSRTYDNAFHLPLIGDTTLRLCLTTWEDIQYD